MVPRVGNEELVQFYYPCHLEAPGLVSNIKWEGRMQHWFRQIATLFRPCVRSRLGWLLAAIHALWLDLGVRTMGPPSRAAANFLDSLQGADWTLFAGRSLPDVRFTSLTILGIEVNPAGGFAWGAGCFPCRSAFMAYLVH